MSRRLVVLLMVIVFTVSSMWCLTGCGNKQNEAPEPQDNTGEPADNEPADKEPADGEPADKEPVDPTGGGDFDVSGAKWVWIDWNADGADDDEQMEFEYHDNGDEAASVIEITLYHGDDQIQGWIDNAYKINRILSLENEAGPYLQVDYQMGDYYSHDNEGHCYVSFVDGELKVEYVE